MLIKNEYTQLVTPQHPAFGYILGIAIAAIVVVGLLAIIASAQAYYKS